MVQHPHHPGCPRRESPLYTCLCPPGHLAAQVAERQAAERAALAARHTAERVAFEQDDHPANARPEPTEEEATALWGPIDVDEAGPEEFR